MQPLENFSGRMFGYARVSTDEQSLNLQIDALVSAGVAEDMIFSEKISGKNMERPQWKKLLRVLRSGDCVVVWKLDRLGRSMIGVLEAIEGFNSKGIHFRILRDNIDTTTPMGAFIMHLFAAIAQLERDMISQRTKAGVEAAKKRGAKFGRQGYVYSHPKRLKKFHALAMAGELREMSALDIINAMHKADPKAPKWVGDQGYKNWYQKNYPGLREAFEAAGLPKVPERLLPKPKPKKRKK